MTKPQTPPTPNTKCGFVSVIGLPNAGKSTLINHLVGAKVSIVSRKTHTTRNRILGIMMHNTSQIILIDTPGIFDAAGSRQMERAMVGAAFEALEESDYVLHLVDAAIKNPLQRNHDIIQKLNPDKPTILVLNKTDKVHKPDLLKLATAFSDQYNYAAIFMISSLKGSGTDDVLDYLAQNLPNSEYIFDEDDITDMPMRMMAAEITREKIFNQLHEELPYSAMVYTESWEDFENGDIKITQLVFVERDSQKAIVLGKGGSRIKQIGQEAREELSELFERKIHLKLLVKVKDGWAEKSENLRLMGLTG